MYGGCLDKKDIVTTMEYHSKELSIKMVESLIINSHSWMESIDRELDIPHGALMRRARFDTKACLQSWRILYLLIEVTIKKLHINPRHHN